MSAKELAVYICERIFEGTHPVLLVAHDDGDWQFLCGGHHEPLATSWTCVKTRMASSGSTASVSQAGTAPSGSCSPTRVMYAERALSFASWVVALSSAISIDWMPQPPRTCHP